METHKSMRVEVVQAGEDLKPVVLNLGMYYIYDYSEFLGFSCQPDGLFRTSQWAKYWTEPGRSAFLVKVDGEVAGFVLVGPDGTQSGTQFDVGQFFIMRKFRRRGVGERVAFDVFDRFRGRWEVRVLVQNGPAVAFWRKVIRRYTDGKYHELPEPVQCGEWRDIVLTFDNSAPRAA